MNNMDLDMFKLIDIEDYFTKKSFQNSYEPRSQLSNTFRQNSITNQKYSELANY